MACVSCGALLTVSYRLSNSCEVNSNAMWHLSSLLLELGLGCDYSDLVCRLLLEKKNAGSIHLVDGIARHMLLIIRRYVHQSDSLQHRLALKGGVKHHFHFIVAECDIENSQRQAVTVYFVRIKAQCVVLVGQAFRESGEA